MFFVFEGVDGSGKSTQARLLAEHLREERGLETLLVREPGGTPLGEKLRGLILSGREPLCPETELYLFMAARSHLVRSRILPALEKGIAVVSDRFLWSSVVYQGIANGIGAAEVLRVGRLAARGVEVTRTFVIDLDPTAAYSRVKDPNRMEERGLGFQRTVRKGFLSLAAKHPGKLTLIDGRGAIEDVHARVLAKLPTRGWPAISSR